VQARASLYPSALETSLNKSLCIVAQLVRFVSRVSRSTTCQSSNFAARIFTSSSVPYASKFHRLAIRSPCFPAATSLLRLMALAAKKTCVTRWWSPIAGFIYVLLRQTCNPVNVFRRNFISTGKRKLCLLAKFFKNVCMLSWEIRSTLSAFLHNGCRKSDHVASREKQEGNKIHFQRMKCSPDHFTKWESAETRSA